MPTATQDTTYTYDQNGRLLTETTGGLVTSYEYNNAGLVTKKTNKVGDVEPGSVYGGVSDFSTHTYYTNGNMMSKFSQAELCETSYTYDGAGRLTLEFFQSSGPDYQTIYQYDASGNRSRQTYIFDPYNETNDLFTTVTEYTYDANNRLTSVTTGTDTLSYTYDNNGNMLSESNGKTYSYNVLNQLVTFVNGEYTTTYTYLPNGLRASKTMGNDQNHLHSDFVWDGDDLVYEYVRNMYYYPPLDNCIVYNYGNGLISQSNTETNEYILFTKNTHGDVSDMLNASSTTLAVFAEKEFDAFGNGGSTGYSAMGYAGQYHDYETGFIYLRARYYSPAVGRFINEDPIRDGLNWYVYCGNNPVNYTDSTGLDEDLDKYVNDNYSGKVTVTIAASRPVENSRIAVNLDTMDVGHTFVRIDYGDGRVIYRGFYPANTLSTDEILTKTNVDGIVVDDATHDWNAAVTYEITVEQADDMVSFIDNYDSEYNMVTNNCTTFGAKVLESGGVEVPTSEHKWTLPANAKQMVVDYLPSEKLFKGVVANYLISGLYGYSPADAVQDFKNSPQHVLKYGGSTYVASNKHK